MSFFGRLFGTDKAIEKTIEAAGKILDEAFYTNEEEAADRSEARREAQGMVIDWMRNTQGQNLSRRLIALSITGGWLVMHGLSSLLALGSVWAGKRTDKLIESSELLDARLDGMTGAVMLILSFYFAAPYLGDITKGALERFSRGSGK